MPLINFRTDFKNQLFSKQFAILLIATVINCPSVWLLVIESLRAWFPNPNWRFILSPCKRHKAIISHGPKHYSGIDWLKSCKAKHFLVLTGKTDTSCKTLLLIWPGTICVSNEALIVSWYCMRHHYKTFVSSILQLLI